MDASMHLAGDCWDKWLSLWRIGCLAVVSPWDDAIRAFAERAEFLPRRMAALGLDRNSVATADPAGFADLVANCASCESSERCEWDLAEDPADPAWLDYCPNSQTLTTLGAGKIN